MQMVHESWLPLAVFVFPTFGYGLSRHEVTQLAHHFSSTSHTKVDDHLPQYIFDIPQLTFLT
jgi:hypothetical protein